MKLTKIGHASLLLEQNGERLLIDPGVWSFLEGDITPESLSPIDVVLITHEHPDHFAPDILKTIAIKKRFPIFTNSGVAKAAEAAGIAVEVIPPGTEKTFGTFRVRGVSAPHGALPPGFTPPENYGFVINETLFHPGDSLAPVEDPHVPVLALPITAPWLTLRESVLFGQKLNPQFIIPIHDAIAARFWRESFIKSRFATFFPGGASLAAAMPGEALDL